MITVREAILLTELNNVTVRAGKRGLFRKIRWAHVIDHDDMRHFLEGGELLLTSGQVWPQDKPSEDRLLKGFLQHQISGILFATGRYLDECPPSVLEFGEKYAIPILEVPFHVRFVKLTHSIHQEIVKREYRKKELTAKLPLKLTEKLGSSNSSMDVCRNLATHFNCPAVITDPMNKVLDKIIPAEEKRINLPQTMDHLIKLLNERSVDHLHENEPIIAEGQPINVSTKTSPYAMAVPLQIEGNYSGTLWLLNFYQPLNETHALALKYAATVLLDIHLNQQIVGVTNKQFRTELMELLFENPKTASILMKDRMHKLGLTANENWVAGFVLPGIKKIPLSLSIELDFLSNECTNWIQQTEGIDGFCAVYEGRLTLLISSSLEYSEIKNHLKNLYSHVQTIYKQIVPVLVFGEMKADWLSLVESYQEAKSLTPLVQFSDPAGGAYFAEESRGELLLYGGMDSAKAQEFRNLILPEELLSERGSVLYETLKCLAAHNYNREIVAKALHIHRNTLRYRIDRIEHYLEDSLSSSKCQFWIQIALALESLADHIHGYSLETDDDKLLEGASPPTIL
ncbi:PucR family transcriptional regulator [Bacillus sp. 37MA]|uniref:PucR family transcriptional regulator n=1 Tax=Bacillus sp. 37MA TaxID=1132442 RepID=UPI0003790DB3|nr:PucR family transcriptional regulator [Bacillus sp. 37MA]